MEEKWLGRAPAGARRTSWAVHAFIGAASLGLVVALSIGSALANSGGCRIADGIVSAGGKLESLALRLKRHEPVRILAIGSSSTQGIGASSPGFSYPAQLQTDLTGIWRTQVMLKMPARVARPFPKQSVGSNSPWEVRQTELVIWQVGTNDAVQGGDEASFETSLREGIDAVREAGADIILLDQQFYPGIKDVVRYERFVRLIGTTAIREKVPVFSRYKLMKEWGDRSGEVLASMLSADRFHMGDRGYDCIAQLMAASINSLSGKDGAPGLASTITAQP